jgi:hypothetical protein
MWDILIYLLLLALVAGTVLGAAILIRAYMTGTSPASALFGPRPERRLDVVEHASLDGRRRLVLIRRDDVEHLIMTGGPVDVVIETGIKPPYHPIDGAEVASAAPAAVYARGPRPFGEAPGDL